MTVLRPVSLMAFIASLLITAIPALAQPAPEVVARRCIQEIRSTARDAVSDIEQATARGIHAMVRANNNDATDEELTGAAERIKERQGNIADRAGNRVSNLGASCIERLTEAGAGQALIDGVAAAGAAAAENLGNRLERGRVRVDAALARLLG